MITSQTATTLRVLGTYTRYRLSPSVKPTNSPSSALGSCLSTSLSRFLMKTVQSKINNLGIESLGFIPRINSAGHFSSPGLKIKFLILVAWRIAAPHIKLGRPPSMSQHPVISSSVLLHLSANAFCCGVSGIVFSCRMPASKHYILNCSERNSFALSCFSFLGVPTLRTNFFRLAGASLFALIKSTNTN